MAILGLAWAAVGVLSGHMYVAMLFHFDGRSALCVSAAILAGATALAIQATRPSGPDDPDVWNGWTRTLGWATLACTLLACAIESGEWLGLLRDTDGGIGFLSTEALRDLCTSPHLARWLAPLRPGLERWTAIGAGAGLVWALVWRLWTRKEPTPHGPGMVISLVLVAPAVACGTLLGVGSLVSGGPTPDPSDGEDDYRALLAFTQSATLLGLFITACLFESLRQAVLRVTGRSPGT